MKAKITDLEDLRGIGQGRFRFYECERASTRALGMQTRRPGHVRYHAMQYQEVIEAWRLLLLRALDDKSSRKHPILLVRARILALRLLGSAMQPCKL